MSRRTYACVCQATARIARIEFGMLKAEDAEKYSHVEVRQERCCVVLRCAVLYCAKAEDAEGILTRRGAAQ